MHTPVFRADALRIHHLLPSSLANGPGLRAVVWVQGCALGCPGCFNPESHDFSAGEVITTKEMAARIMAVKEPIQGITISGGEPFHQHRALARLLADVRAQKDLSVLVFSGYTLEEINRLQAQELLAQIDVLIAGRYQAQQRIASGLIGSANKSVHFLTSRYSPVDLANVPETEVLISPDGEIILSGINPLTW